MPTVHQRGALDRLRRAALLHLAADVTDGQLLERYVSHREEGAFEALVRRHGPMVLGVCRRLLPNPHDAEDAFQATFLVLVRKAASIVPRDRIAGWLYGVAYHAALKARSTAARRRTKERQVRHMPEPVTLTEGLWHDLVPLLDRELSLLPDRYRLPVVLCDLEGKTRKEAARQLGWPEGTVAGRLARGRALLARRLTRHGLPLSGAVLAVVLSQSAASAAVPWSLVHATLEAAALTAAGKAAAGTISAPVVALTEGVLKVMMLNKLKMMTAVVLALVLVSGSAGLVTHQALAAAQSPTADEQTSVKHVKSQEGPRASLTVKNAVLEAVDTGRGTVTVKTGQLQSPLVGVATPSVKFDAVTLPLNTVVKLDTVKLPVNTVVKLDAVTLPVNTVVKLDEVKLPVNTAVKLDSATLPLNTVVKFDAVTMPVNTVVKLDSVTLPQLDTVKLQVATPSETKLEGLPVAKNARILIKGKPGTLSELKAGMHITLELGIEGERLVVIGIKAE
jgi:RNA polymerase sigma factor (sigma-70 family)